MAGRRKCYPHLDLNMKVNDTTSETVRQTEYPCNSDSSNLTLVSHHGQPMLSPLMACNLWDQVPERIAETDLMFVFCCWRTIATLPDLITDQERGTIRSAKQIIRSVWNKSLLSLQTHYHAWSCRRSARCSIRRWGWICMRRDCWLEERPFLISGTTKHM